MKSVLLSPVLAISFLLASINCHVFGQEPKPLPEENFYTKSLHYTNKGIEYWYSKEQGGLERLTGVRADQLGCLKSKCHVRSCDVCHAKVADAKFAYSVEAARSPQVCHECHGELEKDNPDVHFAKGMKCMDCHSARELHGDGVSHNTYMEPGVLDARCEKCHPTIGQSASHTVHKGKLDCNVCHSLGYQTCLNCHIESRTKEKKGGQIPLKNMVFLVNHDGKVALGNMLSYVYHNKTMITFAPVFSHSTGKEGRKCGECHDSKIVRDMNKNKFKLVKWENGGMKNVEGVIPVLDGFKWDLVYLDRIDTTWVPLEKPEEPLLNYSGYSSPITREQFDKLARAQGTR